MKQTITVSLHFICWLVGGLAAGRLLYEATFPALPRLGQWKVVIPLAVLIAAAMTVRLRRQPFWVSLPLLLNAAWLFTPTADLVAGRVWFGTAVLLTAGLILPPRRWTSGLLVTAGLLPLYAATLGRTVGRADTFEFQTVAPQLGIAHPTGYPLYLLLGKAWTLLPTADSVAQRLNIGTAVYGVLAAVGAAWLIQRLLQTATADDRPHLAWALGVVGALAAATRPTFWSQAVAAEVYTLHNLFVVAVLGVCVWQLTADEPPAHRWVWAAGLLGLGLTNHLTTVILAPAVALSAAVVWTRQREWSAAPGRLARMTAAFLLPLTLYAYLPLRWRAVNGEPMGASRFLDWVMGGRFQGALQPWAFWRDPARYEVVGRLFTAEWPTWVLALAVIGLITLLWRRWAVAAVLAVTWAGYSFYALSYYVPDLNVFLLPAQLIIAVWAAVGAGGLLVFWGRWLGRGETVARWAWVLIIPVALGAIDVYGRVDQSQRDTLTRWGTAVLEMDLDRGAAILADSEKIAPLYYLQQAEGMRPDLEIMVLPDEAAYRAELNTRLAAGQTVYLARYLPQLASVYHLRSVGPLTQADTRPVTQVPPTAVPRSDSFGAVNLAGIEIERESAVAARETAVTFYWQATQPDDNARRVYVRWAGGDPVTPTGIHPANDFYPTVAWRSGEIVPDFHRLPWPADLPDGELAVEVALAPAFTPPQALDWRTVDTVDFSDVDPPQRLADGRPVRILFADGSAVTAVQMPDQIRPGDELPVALAGPGSDGVTVDITAVDDDNLAVTVAHPPHAAVCGWLQPAVAECEIGRVRQVGVPVPDGATNFGDRFALLGVAVADTSLTPGGTLDLTVRWQALADEEIDYTVFVQVLDAADRIVGQVDSFPLQGTYPTSEWEVGEVVRDPYAVHLDSELPPGQYRLIIGFYNLADLQRLPVVNAEGNAVGDFYEVPGLVVE